MKILAIDTSSAQGIVALQTDTNEIKVAKNHEPLEHNRFLLPAIQTVLHEAHLNLNDIDYFAASVGPGSFVGTRLAVAVIQGLAFGCNKPVVAVSHLALMAEACFATQALTEITIRLDAHMQGFYQGHFHRDRGLMGIESFQRFTEEPPEFTSAPTFTGKHLIDLAQRKILTGEILQDPALLQPVYLQDESNWKKQSL